MSTEIATAKQQLKADKKSEPPQSRALREKAGNALRERTPRSSHAEWKAVKKGRDVLDILRKTDEGRLETLLPIRYARMLQSPFAFFRGSAAVMAFDLAESPVSGIRVQACGDCHLMNFGGFATPERNLVFDVNDFDETLPAPWEWDIKRLAASIMVAARYRHFSASKSSAAVLTTVRSYRERLAYYSRLPVLDVWYERIDAREIVELGLPRNLPQTLTRSGPHVVDRAHAHTAGLVLPKMCTLINGKLEIKDNPPLVYHAPSRVDYKLRIREALKKYRESLPDERRSLLDRYRFVDVAMKVVGVGSVGTRCAVALFLAEDNDALFLQFKEARASVLEPYAGKSAYRNHAQRVVVGQRLMQSASDMFLGWSDTGNPSFDFYVRQLRDMKTSVNLDALRPDKFSDYCRFCGWALARAHAKTGDSAMISGYLGKNDSFDRALEQFAQLYADQTEKDHATLVKAVKSGRMKADSGRSGKS